MNIIQKPVKNYTPGRKGYKPEAIVLHIAEGSLVGGHSWFNNPTSQASAHYMIGKAGQVWQFVDENNIAWHAGGINKPSWSLLKTGVNPNNYTIGIEHEGFTGNVFTAEMFESSAQLIAQACQRWAIPVDSEHIIGHNRINSVTRGRCPGAGLDFQKLFARVNQILYPVPEWKKNAISVGPLRFISQKQINLYNIQTHSILRQYIIGEEFIVHYLVDGYYMAEYSYSKNIPAGFLKEDLEYVKPEPPKPEPPQLDFIDSLITVFKDLINKLWKH